MLPGEHFEKNVNSLFVKTNFFAIMFRSAGTLLPLQSLNFIYREGITLEWPVLIRLENFEFINNTHLQLLGLWR